MKPFWWPDMRAMVVSAIILTFIAVMLLNPADETLKGALIAAFAGAWGYYLGSSKGSREANERVDKALDVASAVAGKDGDHD